MTREVDREEQILEREDVNMTGPLFDTGISFFLEDLEEVGAEWETMQFSFCEKLEPCIQEFIIEELAIFESKEIFSTKIDVTNRTNQLLGSSLGIQGSIKKGIFERRKWYQELFGRWNNDIFDGREKEVIQIISILLGIFD